MTHKKQHSECAVPLGIKWVRFQCGIQKCCGLLQEDDAVCVGSCGSAWGLETPWEPWIRPSAHALCPPPTSSHSHCCTGTSTLGTASELASAMSKGSS